jgi:hypothetical protein
VGVDIVGYGFLDVLVSYRKGPMRGVFWLENTALPLPPGEGRGEGAVKWPEHRIGGEDHEVMFLDYADLDGDRRMEIVVAAKPRRVLVYSQPDDVRAPWTAATIELAGNLGNAKAVRVADLDLDGRADLIVSCEGATGDKSGGVWFTHDKPKGARIQTSGWSMRDISGAAGTKFDRMEVVDLDDDGDLDVITCEEAENLGVIWYENPAR